MSLRSMGCGRIESSFSDMSISAGGGFGSSSGFGLSIDIESFSTKSKGHPSSPATAPPKGLGMQLGIFEGRRQIHSRGCAADESWSVQISCSATDRSHHFTVEEKLNVMLKRDGGVSNFDVQGTLALQILNQEDGHFQVQIETGGNPGILFKTHPNMNKELFSNENI